MAQSTAAGQRTVLVVDDDEDIRTITAAALGMIGGHRVLTAAGGQEALSLVSHEAVDAVLLDVSMPGMSGLQTLEALRRDPQTSQVPVVLLTARLQVEGDEVANAAVTGMIAKPFDPMELSTAFARLLGWAG